MTTETISATNISAHTSRARRHSTSATDTTSTTTTSSDNVNYISIGMKRLKELSTPVISLLNSLNPSQRRMALIAVGIIFFWPLLLLALNLPWMLSVACALYSYYFGTRKFYSDANEAAKDHLSVDFEEKGHQVHLKFQQSQFPGKETLIYGSQRLYELAIVAYKSALLASMTLLDYLVTLLLNLARSAKKLATSKQQTHEN